MGAGRTGEPQSNQRLTVAQAAASLGITEGAVRSRIKRGTLPTTKESGTVFVLLGGSTSQANQTPNASVPGAQSELVEELRDRVAFLEREMKRRGDETERLHQIVAGLAQANAEQARTIRAIEAPASQESPEDAETVEEEAGAPIRRRASDGLSAPTGRAPAWPQAAHLRQIGGGSCHSTSEGSSLWRWYCSALPLAAC
jgi:hypothetical protein